MELPEKIKEITEELNRKIAASKTLEDIATTLFHETQKLLPCDRLEIGILEEDGRLVMTYCVTANYRPLYLKKGFVSDTHAGFMAQSLETHRPWIIHNLSDFTEDDITRDSLSLLLREGIVSLLLCPLVIYDTVFGILYFGSKKEKAYTESHLSIIGDQMSYLSSIVDKTYRMEMITNKYNAFMEILSIISHEIKSPIDSLITLGNTMVAGYFGPLDEKHRQILQRMIRKAEYVTALSREYLSLARFESGQFKLNAHLVDFYSEVIEPSIDVVQPQFDEKKVNLFEDFKESIYPIKCDPDLMIIVMVNLMSNAVKYGIAEGTVKLSLSRKFNRFSVSVWNQGPGFSEEEKNLLFKKFSRLQSPGLEPKKGTGIGLYVSRQIVNLHGGSIWAESEPGKWARFSFDLPQYFDLGQVISGGKETP